MTNADWGCEDGIHCCWMIVERNSRDEAMQMLPVAFRQQARVIKLNRFTRDQIASRMAELSED